MHAFSECWNRNWQLVKSLVNTSDVHLHFQSNVRSVLASFKCDSQPQKKIFWKFIIFEVQRSISVAVPAFFAFYNLGYFSRNNNWYFIRGVANCYKSLPIKPARVAAKYFRNSWRAPQTKKGCKPLIYLCPICKVCILVCQ